MDSTSPNMAHPAARGRAKAALGPIDHLMGQMRLHRLLQHPLAHPAPLFEARRDAGCKTHQIEVQKRHAHLHPGRHRHLVCVGQVVICQKKALLQRSNRSRRGVNSGSSAKKSSACRRLAANTPSAAGLPHAPIIPTCDYLQLYIRATLGQSSRKTRHRARPRSSRKSSTIGFA